MQLPFPVIISYIYQHLQESMEYEYKYEVEESYFKESSKDKTKVSCLVRVSCEAGTKIIMLLMNYYVKP